MDALTVLPRLGIILLMILLGAAARQGRVLCQEDAATLNRLAFHVFLPLLVFSSICKSLTGDVLTQAGWGVLTAAAIHLVCYLLSFAYVRVLGLTPPASGVHQFSLVFSNVAFVGLPIIQALWGDDAMPVASVFVVLFSLFNHTLGAFILSGERSNRSAREILVTPPLAGAIAGIVVALAGVQIPQALFSGLEQLGAVTTPLAMVALGCTLASMGVRSLAGDWRIYLTCFVRLVVIPVAVWGILRLATKEYYLWAVPTLVCAMPCPSTLPILAQRYRSDEVSAGNMVAVTTVFASITIPLLILFLL